MGVGKKNYGDYAEISAAGLIGGLGVLPGAMMNTPDKVVLIVAGVGAAAAIQALPKVRSFLSDLRNNKSKKMPSDVSAELMDECIKAVEVDKGEGLAGFKTAANTAVVGYSISYQQIIEEKFDIVEEAEKLFVKWDQSSPDKIPFSVNESILLKKILEKYISTLILMEAYKKDTLIAELLKIGELSARLEKLENEILENKESLYPAFVTGLPFTQCDYFLGREVEVEELYREICSRNKLLLAGIGGIGKTEIVKNVIFRIMNESTDIHGYESIAWVDYDNTDIRESIIRSLFVSSSITDVEEAWKIALQYIVKQGKKLLLVIDNIERDEDRNLLKLAPLPCEVIITSRVNRLTGFTTKEIGALSEENCVSLFKKLCTKRSGTDCHIRQIVGLADYLTVVVELLAKIAEQENGSLIEFLEELKASGFHLSKEEASSIHSKLQDDARIIVQLALLFSISKLSDEEKDLLVPISVIPSMAFTYTDAKEWFQQENHKQLNRLVKTGWLTGRGDKYLIHSVIASAIRYHFQETLYSRCRDFMKVLTQQMEYPNDAHGAAKTSLIQFSWAIREMLKDHYCDEQDADFMLYLSRIFTDIANYEQAVTLLRHCVRLYAKDRSTIVKQISCYNQIGICYKCSERYKFALTQYKKAFQLAQKYEVDLKLWITLYADAALVFMKTDGFEKDGFADTYLKHAYSLALGEYGLDHYETWRIISLWNHCIATYEPESAKENFEFLVEKEEAKYGKTHPHLAELYASYALFLDDNGDYKNSLSYYKKAYDAKCEIMGPKHPDTIDLANSMALINFYIGQFDEAKKLFEDCLDATLEIEGKENPTYATILNNLAMLRFNEEQYEDAYDLFLEAGELYQQCTEFYGNTYTEDVARILRNEGQCLSEIAGDMIRNIKEKGVYATERESAEIRNKLYQAVDKFKESISILMPEQKRYQFMIAENYGALANAYEYLDWKEDAEKCFHRAIDDITECYHDRHPSLAYLYNNYGQFLDSQDRLEEALYYVKQAQETLRFNGALEDSLNMRAVRAAVKGIEAKLKEA